MHRPELLGIPDLRSLDRLVMAEHNLVVLLGKLELRIHRNAAEITLEFSPADHIRTRRNLGQFGLAPPHQPRRLARPLHRLGQSIQRVEPRIAPAPIAAGADKPAGVPAGRHLIEFLAAVAKAGGILRLESDVGIVGRAAPQAQRRVALSKCSPSRFPAQQDTYKSGIS